MEKTPHVMLSGEGAAQFAINQGFKKENLLTDKAKAAWQEWLKKAEYHPKINSELHDTIGILAIDQNKNISAACSTSGLAFKMHGRVGDSPIIGGSVFCDNEVGGAVATGLGEFVMKTLGSFLIVELMRTGKTPQKACEEAVNRIVKRYAGKPLTQYFDYKKAGIWQTAEADAAKAYGSRVGQIKVEDFNNDGKINADDRQFLGSEIPDFSLGITNRFAYKGFDVSAIIFARIGQTILSGFHQSTNQLAGRYQQIKVDYWTPNNPTNEFPQPNKDQEFP
ncbi:hypothetical protein B566_EDAN019221, partial [Ephemera danica]